MLKDEKSSLRITHNEQNKHTPITPLDFHSDQQGRTLLTPTSSHLRYLSGKPTRQSTSKAFTVNLTAFAPSPEWRVRIGIGDGHLPNPDTGSEKKSMAPAMHRGI